MGFKQGGMGTTLTNVDILSFSLSLGNFEQHL